jgi:hypothetical protein
MRIVIPNQPAGTNLIIKARSKNGTAFSDWSRNFAVTTIGDTTPPKTPANPVETMAGTSFTLKWDAVTQSTDNTPASDLDRYEVKVTSSGSLQSATYVTKDTKFEFSFEQNVSLFGTPQANVQMAVRAIDTAGNASGYSATQSQTNPAPAAPTGLTGAAGNYSLSFTWNAVSDLDLKQYRIYQGATAGSQGTLVWTGTALNATIQINDTTNDKYYKVVAVDVFNTESATSNVVGPIKPTSPVSVDTTAPAVPTTLAGTLTNSADGTSASMAVSWVGVSDSDLDSYILAFRQNASPVNDWQYQTVDKTNTTTTIQGLVPYKAYDIRIRAKDFSANYSNWTTIVNVAAQANTAPAVPTGLAIVTGKDNITLSWNENTELDMKNNAGTYDVTIATDSGFSAGVLQYRTAATTLSVNGLASSQIYYARVRATDSGGLSSAYSSSVNGTTGNYSGLGGGSKYTVAATAPSSPAANDVWMDTTSGFEKYWTGSAWANTGNVSLAYNTSRGDDLVTNGTALMKNNYNFPGFDYNGVDAPTGASGSFVIKTTGSQSSSITEMIPFDPTKAYKFAFQSRQTVSGSTNCMYGFISPFDAFDLSIAPYNYMYIAGTTTTLAADLKPGDTTVKLTSPANWFGTAGKNAGAATYYRGFIFWDYTDPAGKTWPTGTYSRNAFYQDMFADGGIAADGTVTLRAPWPTANGTHLAGTAVSQTTSGGNYIYMPTATNVVVPETWTTYTDTFSAGVMNPSLQAIPATGNAGWTTGVPPGTAKIKVGWLMNYPGGSIAGKHAVAAVSLSTAAAAWASANGKNKIVRSTSAPASTTGYAEGDLWWQVDASNNVIGQWRIVSGAWVAEKIKSDIIANLDVNKLTAGSGFITDLSIAAGGVIKSANYVANTSGFRLSDTGLIIEAGSTIKADTFKGGTINGTTISVGAGGVLTVDSTGAIRSNNYAIGATGYRMDASGLEVNDGSIDAKVLKTNTAIVGDLTIGRSADALGTIKSFDYSAGTAGWKIGKGLFEINQGTIRAAALQIQSGASNLEEPQYSAFEFNPSFYTGKFALVNATTSIQTAGGVQGGQFLRISSTTAAAASCQIADSASDYHISVEAGKTYIVSAWMKASTATAVSAYLRLKYNDGSYATAPTPVTLAASGAFTRYSWAFVVPAGITNALVQVFNNTAAISGVDIDGIQVEQQVGGLTTPSTYVMPGSTSMDGAIIRTGQMVSNANVTVNGVQQPAWSINMSGGAQFGDAAVRGAMVVGPTTVTNIAPNNGDFEVAGNGTTGYTPYAFTTTGLTLSRTTTAGEVITGTGSLKVSWTTLGYTAGFDMDVPTATFPNGITPGNVVNIQFKVRGKTPTNSGSAINQVVVDFYDGLGNQLATAGNVLPSPTYVPGDGTVLTVNKSFTLSDTLTANVKKIRIYGNSNIFGSDTGTMLVFDDISITTSDDLGASFISSGNYLKNSRGWKISSGGTAEFNSITLRGAFETASTGVRWQIGTTPQWYGGSADMVALMGVANEGQPTKISAYGGGIMMKGTLPSTYSAGIQPSFYIGNQNFLSSDPGLYQGIANVNATSISVIAQDGPATNGSKYGSSILLRAVPDSSNAGSLVGDSAVKFRSNGADGPAGIDMYADGWVDIYTYDAAANGGVRLYAGDPNYTIYPDSITSHVFVDKNKLDVGGTNMEINTQNLAINNSLAQTSGMFMDQMMYVSRAIDMLTGGGVISVDTAYNIKWSQRFMALDLGRGTNTFTGGYMAITMPAVGTVIPGYGGAANVTVTASGISLSSWCTLWYEPAFGTAGPTSDDSRFRITYFSSDFTVPPHWIPIAVRNNDLAMVYFGNGIGYTPWITPTFTNSWVAFANATYRDPQYRRNSLGRVELRGLMKSGTVNVPAFTLPAGYRPGVGEIFTQQASSGLADLRVFSSGAVQVSAYYAGGTNASVSLAGITFAAEL